MSLTAKRRAFLNRVIAGFKPRKSFASGIIVNSIIFINNINFLLRLYDVFTITVNNSIETNIENHLSPKLKFT